MSNLQTTPKKGKTRLTMTLPDRWRWLEMMDDFIYQIEDDVVREQLRSALNRKRSRYEGTK